MNDFHMHSTYSHDAVSGMEEYIVKAIDDGMQAICFTEHVDCNKVSSGYGKYSPDDFFQELHHMRRKFENRINICAGIEFSEPHLYGEELTVLSKYPYDFILGSVHWLGDVYLGKNLIRKYPAEEVFERYWREILIAVRKGGFDALAHIDLPLRAYQELYYTETAVKEIFKYLVDRNIVLEINTSSIRKGMRGTLIDSALLEIYKDCGGKYITIGSDAHRVQDMGAGYWQASALALKCSLQEVIFKERKSLIANQ